MIGKKKANDLNIGYLLFFIWPLLGFLFSVRNLGNRVARVLVILFFGLFGYTFITPFDDVDSTRHRQYFAEAAARPFSDFYDIVLGLYSHEGVKPDFVQNLIFFCLSRFTSDARHLFMTIAILLGWLLMINIRDQYLVQRRNKSHYALLFILFLFILIPPFRIVSFRQYLADLVFLFGFYRFVDRNDNRYLLLAASSLFIHFSFFLIAPLLVVYRVIGKKNLIFYLLIGASFVLNEQMTILIQNIGLDLGGGFEARADGYMSEKYLEKIEIIKQNRNIILDRYIEWTLYFFLASAVYFKYRLKDMEWGCEKLYSFLLLLFSLINVTRGLPFIADRFSVLFIMMACAFFVRMFSFSGIKPPKAFVATALFFLFVNFVILFRINLMYTSIALVLPILPVGFLYDLDLSILEFFR